MAHRGGKGGRGADLHRTGVSVAAGEHAELVDLVKHAQRSDPQWAAKWKEFCEEYANGTADPSRHNVTFLIQAIKSLGIPTHGDDAKAKIVDSVKMYQRSTPGFVDAWKTHCEEHGDGRLDPSHYDVDFLNDAIVAVKEAAAAATRTAKDERPGEPQLVRRVKDLQKNEPSAHEIWMTFCLVRGKGSFDPKKYDDVFLQAAIEFIEADGEKSHEMLVDKVKEMQKGDKVAHEAWHEYVQLEGDGSANPKKYPEAFLREALQFVNTAVHLVTTIKDLTRSSRGAKEAWRMYCDDHGHSVYDPIHHTSQFLKAALAHLRRAEATGHYMQGYSHVSHGRGRGMSGAPSMMYTGGRGSGRGGGGGAGSLAPPHVVQAFKEMQKANPNMKGFWRSYTERHGGGVLDPAMHDDWFLQRAMADYRRSHH